MKDTRELILETAYTLFMQSSYNAVTMNDIVSQTGLSKGAFYHYFGSKEELFAEVINHVFFGDFSRDYVNMPEIPLKRFLEEELEMVKKRHHRLMDALRSEDEYVPINYYTLIFDALRLLPDFKTRFESYKTQRMDAWERMIELAKRKKEIRTELSGADVAKLFVYINQGMGLSFITGSGLREKYLEIGDMWTNLYNLLKH